MRSSVPRTASVSAGSPAHPALAHPAARHRQTGQVGGVFAVWARAGFAYASAPVPITLNIVSKMLAFVMLFTLFFPRRPQATAGPIPLGNERAQPA
jgi:hypothetical protein